MRRSLYLAVALSWTVAVRAQETALPVDVAFPRAVPFGLPAELPAPADNPLTEASFALGRRLFFDPILSVDRSVSCSSCHLPHHGFSSLQRFPPGVRGRHALRHAPTLLNRGYGVTQRWDGRATSLEEQVLLPIGDPNEMDLAVDEAVARLRASDAYRAEFAAALQGEPDRARLSRALASFVRGLMIGDSPVDRFQAGDRGALTREELAGQWIWESKGRCWRCHVRPLYTDEGFHNTGVAAVDGEPEDGRFAVTGDLQDRGRFKTPTLRGVAHTAPYMHDGSLSTLEDVVAFYRRGGGKNANLSPRIEPLDLTDEDAKNLVAFLKALSRVDPRARDTRER